MSKITLWFLQGSRCIRVAWLLEELGLEYQIKYAEREKGSVPEAFKTEAGGLGKFPTLKDGENVLYESGNIIEYLCDTYDKKHKLLAPIGDSLRYQVLYWLHAAEGTFALHASQILTVRWYQKDGDPAKTEAAVSGDLFKDVDLLETTLRQGKGKFLLGDSVTAADCMMYFIAMSVIKMGLGVKGRTYESIERYVQDCESTESFNKAVAKTGHKL